jgi:hypothetical protein
MSFKILTVCAKLKEGERVWPSGTGERQLGHVLDRPLSQLSKQLVHPEWPHGRVVGSFRISWQQTHERGEASAESALLCFERSCRGGEKRGQRAVQNLVQLVCSKSSLLTSDWESTIADQTLSPSSAPAATRAS